MRRVLLHPLLTCLRGDVGSVLLPARIYDVRKFIIRKKIVLPTETCQGQCVSLFPICAIL